MKYLDDFRDGRLARGIAAAITREAQPERTYRIMEFCGGHTHAIYRYGLVDLLPHNVVLVHGPGCPVCVLPIARVDAAIALATRPGLILCTYGDMLRIPGSKRMTLLKAKAAGADVRMIYSAADAVRIAEQHPQQDVVFFSIGFETTTPPTALVLKHAQAAHLHNFSVVCNHVLTPAAISALLAPEAADDYTPVALDGFIGPAHVSTIIGSAAYEPFAQRYRRPVVISGFEPLDVLQAVLMLVRQLNDGRAEVENEFSRAVTREGNLKAQALMDEVLELRERFEWRGLGYIAHSALRLREAYAAFDAERRFELPSTPVADHHACACGAILRGLKGPTDCKLFGTVCTPDNPMGSCMVSSEGACAAYYSYGRFRQAPGRVTAPLDGTPDATRA